MVVRNEVEEAAYQSPNNCAGCCGDPDRGTYQECVVSSGSCDRRGGSSCCSAQQRPCADPAPRMVTSGVGRDANGVHRRRVGWGEAARCDNPRRSSLLSGDRCGEAQQCSSDEARCSHRTGCVCHLTRLVQLQAGHIRVLAQRAQFNKPPVSCNGR